LQAALGKKARVHNFWIQKYPEVARQHKIMVMPTQVIFNPKGEEVFRHMGYFPPDEFQQTLRKLGIL
jgi:thioredoxin-related protein